MQNILTVENFTKNYGEAVAVQSLSFTVKKGEVFGLLGPNGAGKSTTIKTITGIIQPTSGKVLIDGLDISKHTLKTKSLTGFIPDSTCIIERLTGNEFIEFFGRLYGVDKSVINERKEKLLSLFEISDKRNELLETYSYGTKRKIQVIAALIHSPKLLVADEPFSALDPEMIVVMKKLLKELPSIGINVLIATHNLALAEQICDRVCLINRGASMAIGTVGDILQQTRAANLEEAYLYLINSDAKKMELEEIVKGWSVRA